MPTTLHEKPAPIVEACFTLNLELQEIVARFPKSNKYQLGDQITNRSLNLLADTAKANYNRDLAERYRDITRLQADLFAIRILCRLGHKLKCIPHGQFSALNLKIEDLAKQLHGWAKWAEGASNLGEAGQIKK